MRTPASSSRLSAAVIVMAVLAGCGASNPDPTAGSACSGRNPQGASQLHTHGNGLQLLVPETCQVTATPAGFSVEPFGNKSLRNPFAVSIQLLEMRPKAIGYRFRYLGSGRILRYSVTHEKEGGSSGVDWEVVAFEHVGNHWIQYREGKLAEEQPDELWEIAQGLRYLSSSL